MVAMEGAKKEAVEAQGKLSEVLKTKMEDAKIEAAKA
jgi:hypothetical protein